MRGAKPRLHLPYDRWPAADRLLWKQAMASDDPFADAAGARLSEASQHNYLFAWRRFLGFLATHEPTALEVAPNDVLPSSGSDCLLIIWPRPISHNRSPAKSLRCTISLESYAERRMELV